MPQQLFSYLGKKRIALLIFNNKTSAYLLKVIHSGFENGSVQKNPSLIHIGCSLQRSAAFLEIHECKENNHKVHGLIFFFNYEAGYNLLCFNFKLIVLI